MPYILLCKYSAMRDHPPLLGRRLTANALYRPHCAARTKFISSLDLGGTCCEETGHGELRHGARVSGLREIINYQLDPGLDW